MKPDSTEILNQTLLSCSHCLWNCIRFSAPVLFVAARCWALRLFVILAVSITARVSFVKNTRRHQRIGSSTKAGCALLRVVLCTGGWHD